MVKPAVICRSLPDAGAESAGSGRKWYRGAMRDTGRNRQLAAVIAIAGLLAGCAAGSGAPPARPDLPTADPAVAREEFREAMLLARDGKFAAAAPHYRASALNGNVEAQYVLATMYRTGRGLPRDMEQAVQWYGLAADGGYPMAQFTLANMYMKGDGVARNEPQAVALFEKAAAQNHPQAQYNLGVYHYGLGGEEGFTAAEKWFLKAARQGESSAQYALGNLYSAPHDGIRLDRVRACAWYTLAAANGHRQASVAATRLEAGLSAAERASSRSLARRLAEGA